MALADFSIRGGHQVFQQHGFSFSHQLRVLDVSGVPEYVRTQLIDLEGRAYIGTASLPKVGIQDVEVKYHGFSFHAPGQIEFETEQTWNIRVPSDFLLRDALERWIFETRNPNTSCGMGTFPCESSTIDYAVFGQNCDIARGYRMIGVYPASVGPIQYNQETSNEVVNFDFTFRYQRWEPININDTVALNVPNQLDSVYESFESKIAQGVGNSCAGKSILPGR